MTALLIAPIPSQMVAVWHDATMHWNAFPSATLGYCTNVHPGRTLDEVKTQLDQHAGQVRRRVCPDEPLGVGLWFSEDVAKQLDPAVAGKARAWDFKRWLEGRGLSCFTLNGFPQRDFHQPVVKHAVYEPDWRTEDRRDYTLSLIRILDALLPPGQTGSISTLPVGWGPMHDDAETLAWIDPLLWVLDTLAELEATTGRYIHLNPEPEPGCYVEDTATLDDAFDLLDAAYVGNGGDPAVLRRYLRPCLDVCHTAVMFEPADHLLTWSRRTGFKIGKVQISSAPRIRPTRSAAEHETIRTALRQLVEPRYLHQTTRGHGGRSRLEAFHEDLPEALAAAHAQRPTKQEWRVHFHVPVHLESLGVLGTTQQQIIKLLDAIHPDDGIEHFEVETYAWNVLPETHRPANLADGIAAELEWVRSLGDGAL
ncbi:MAG: metabolite traffic protein EboE [Planctomycetota bacterium]